jgi:RHS repeat-associated protein
VNCSGQFDAWIEEIARDLVTSGCGGGNYCPNNTIGEWEMLVFLAKGRHPSTGAYFWAGYHPVPRGSIFTWRDEGSRVATEGIGGVNPVPPRSYAEILIGRDNVYLGNMLVASYVTDSLYGTAGWQYYASDHLGTPRLVTNASAAKIETRKYWPYGEEVVATGFNESSTQYTRFAGMERDTAFKQYYDHARVQEFNLGRFLTPDLLSGYPEDPKSWNRYSYVLGNPVSLVDPWGLKSKLPDLPCSKTLSGEIQCSGSTDVTSSFSPLSPDMARFLLGLTGMPLGSGGGGGWAGAPFGKSNPEGPCIVPLAPSGVDIHQNIKEAESHRLFGPPWWLYSKVQSHGGWDYKRQGDQYTDFGNFNYGATGRASGWPGFLLEILAGVYSAYEWQDLSPPEWGHPWSGPPWGDDPADQEQISRGVAYYADCY